jgi:5-methyltetrahydropteroyltriglutamate--homocysteine methyltransferase
MIEQFEATGSPMITGGEQSKYHNFWTYSVHGVPNTAPDGFKIPFSAGHVRRMPRLTAGPFRYKVKQIAASMRQSATRIWL